MTRVWSIGVAAVLAALLTIASPQAVVWGQGETAEAIVELLIGPGAQYTEFEYDRKTGRFYVEGLEVENAAQPGTKVLISEMTVTGINEEGLAYIFESTSYGSLGGDTKPRRIFDRADLSRFVRSQKNGDLVSIERITAEGGFMRQLSEPPLDSFISELSDEKRAQIFAEAIKVDTLVLEGINVDLTNEDLTTIEKVTLDDYAFGKLDRLLINGVESFGEMGSVKADNLVVQDLDLTSGVGDKDDFGGEFKSLTVDNILLTEADDFQEMTIDQLRISDLAFAGDILTSMDLQVSGAQIDVADLEDAEMRDDLGAMGYEKLSVDLAYRGTYDMDKKRFEMGQLQFGAEDMGTIALTGALDNFSLDPVSGEFNIFTFFKDTSLSALQIDYKDASFMSRYYKQEAKKQGLGQKAYVQQLKRDLADQRTLIEGLPNGAENYQQLRAFVSDPRRLKITADPNTPVKIGPFVLGVLLAPDLMLSSLNLEVQANP